MGILDVFNNSPVNSATTTDVASQAFTYFHNQSLKYQGYDYKRDVALGLVAANGDQSRVSDQLTTIFLDGFGNIIIQLQTQGFLTGSGVQNAMEALADKSNGQLPNRNSFFSAIGNTASNPSFLTIVQGGTDLTVQALADDANKVVDTVQSVAGAASWIVPVALIGIVGFIVFSRTKQLAGV